MSYFFSRAGLALVLAFSCFAHAQTTPPPGGQMPPVKWEIKNRFPLFRSDTAVQDVLQLTPGQSLHDWSRDVLAKNGDLLKGFTKAYVHKDGKGCATRIAAGAFPTLWDPCTETYMPELFEKKNYRIVVELIAPLPGRCRFKVGDAEKMAGCAEKVELRVPAPDRDYSLTVEQDNGTVVARDTVRIRDVLLLAFGDSFSSGESNPDVPALHEDGPMTQGDGQMVPGVHWLDSPHKIERPAAWLDSRCHRSVLSWPILSAARLALENPHMVVRMASWACSGAEITDGFYSPQRRAGTLGYSQFEAARRVLCNSKNGSGTSFKPVVRLGKGQGIRTGTEGASIKGCADGDFKIKADAVMFTLGGNDVFFAPVLFDAVMMTGLRYLAVLNPLYKPLRKGIVRTPEEAHARIDGKASNYDNLPVRFASLGEGLMALGISRDRTFQVQYPNPLYDSKDRICDISPDDGMDVVEKLQRVANLSEDESKRAEFHVINPLTKLIDENRQNWKVVNGHVNSMRPHGLCAFNTDRPREFAMPRLANGNWVNNYKPSGYQHYANTARWFRTPDDVAMGMYEGSPFLPIEGAFHPSAKSHAFIADEVFKQLSKSLLAP